MNEPVDTGIKQKFGGVGHSRLSWKQFRELVLNCNVHNLDLALAWVAEISVS